MGLDSFSVFHRLLPEVLFSNSGSTLHGIPIVSEAFVCMLADFHRNADRGGRFRAAANTSTGNIGGPIGRWAVCLRHGGTTQDSRCSRNEGFVASVEHGLSS